MLSQKSANPGNGDIKQMLEACKNIAVVGLSDKPARDSYRVAKYLQDAGYTIIPVNPVLQEVLGEKCYPDLASVPHDIDVVDVFRRSEFVPEIAEEAGKVGAKCLWLQLGVRNQDCVGSCERAGMMLVQDACLKVYHRNLLG